jgi:hypothetical protein
VNSDSPLLGGAPLVSMAVGPSARFRAGSESSVTARSFWSKRSTRSSVEAICSMRSRKPFNWLRRATFSSRSSRFSEAR